LKSPFLRCDYATCFYSLEFHFPIHIVTYIPISKQPISKHTLTIESVYSVESVQSGYKEGGGGQAYDRSSDQTAIVAGAASDRACSAVLSLD
jgi:hypothetical protein